MNFDLNYDVDPLFKIITNKFGDSKNNNFLQNLLPIEPQKFDYILEEYTQEKNPENSEKLEKDNNTKNKKNNTNLFEIQSIYIKIYFKIFL